MDDLEWTEGGGTRLGLLYVDVTTPRRSGMWYREAARRDAVG
jgi:beta-glucosidase/6-phospho-beta-glucosidase/beta-galactosidase